MSPRVNNTCPQAVHEAMKADPDVWNKLEFYARKEGLEYRQCDKCNGTLAKFENDEDDYEDNPGWLKKVFGKKEQPKGHAYSDSRGRRLIHNDMIADPRVWNNLELVQSDPAGDEWRRCNICGEVLAGWATMQEPDLTGVSPKGRKKVEEDWAKSQRNKNPGSPTGDTPSGDPEPPRLDAAVGKFEEFHKYSAKGYGPFAPKLKIPDTISFMGEATYVAYNSNKWGEKASYIHHHDCGNCSHEREDHYDDEPYPCEKWGCNCKRFRSNVKFFMPSSGGQRVEVPSFIKSARTLTRLGKCLEFCYVGSDGNFKEHKSGSGYELFCIPSGKALLIIADKSRLVAMVWGGKLNVKDVGIVG